MPGRPFSIAIASAFAVALGLQLFFFSMGFYSIGWEESARTLDAYSWVHHRVILTGAWLPFYRVVVGWAVRLFPDLFLTPRVISFLFGVAAIAATAWLTHEIFQSSRTTLISVALSVFFSQRIVLSLAPVSSILFTTTILTAMAALARWLRTYDRNALWICGLAAAVAGTNRYEGWVFEAAILLAVVICKSYTPDRITARDLVFLGLILITFPAIWAAGTFIGSNPIQAVVRDASRFSLREVLIRNPLAEFVATNALSLNLIGMAAVLRFFRTGDLRQRTLVTVLFTPLLCISLGLLLMRSAQTGASWRDICVWSMLAIPFTASLLSGAAWRFPAGSTGKLIQAGLLLIVISTSLYNVVRLRRDSSWAFPESDRLAGSFLNSLASAARGKKILIESSTYAYLNLEVASQQPDSFLLNGVPEQPGVPLLSPRGSIRRAVDELGVRFLVFQSDEYKSSFSHNPDVTKVQDFGRWSVYTAR